MTAPQRPPAAASLNVAAEIHVALSLVTDHARARGVKLTVGIQPELFLQADPLVFREVISNVLAGAIDAANSETPSMARRMRWGMRGLSIAEGSSAEEEHHSMPILVHCLTQKEIARKQFSSNSKRAIVSPSRAAPPPLDAIL